MSFPRYEGYKETGVLWLEKLPTLWSFSKVKFNTYVKGRVGWHGLNSDEFSDVGVHLVTGTDFVNGFVVWDSCCRVSEDRYAEDPYIQLKEGDLLITKDGTIGKLARVKGLPERASLNSGIFLVRAQDNAYLEDFLYWVLQSSLFAYFMDLHKSGSTIQHLYQEVFNQFSFPLPSQFEQHHICIFLDRETAKINALISEQQRLIDLLKEKRKAVISHAVNKGLNTDAPMKDSGVEWLGEVPAHWGIKKMKWVAEMQSGHTPDKKIREYWEGGDIPWVSLNDTVFLKDHDYISETAYNISQLGIENSSARLLPPRAVVFSRDATIGRCAITTRPMAVSQHFIAWICGDTMIPEFLLLRLRSMEWELDRLTTGATLKTIGMPEVRTIVTPVPPLKEQQSIIEWVKNESAKLGNLTAEAQIAINLLQERRVALISAAVTGKIDVRLAA